MAKFLRVSISESEVPFVLGTGAAVLGTVGIQNASSVVINPATEDTLATLLAAPTTGTVLNATITTANTEYTQALPANVRGFNCHLRDYSEFRLAFVTGKVATPTEPYISVGTGASYNKDNIKLSTLTLFFAAPANSKTMEVDAWA